MTQSNGAGHRRHVRCTVYEPCIAAIDSQEYSGAVVDMSVGGAAVRLEVEVEVQPAPDTPMQLQIEGIRCWTPHVEITRAAFEATLDIFEYNGIINERFSYGQICSAPPAID